MFLSILGYNFRVEESYARARELKKTKNQNVLIFWSYEHINIISESRNLMPELATLRFQNNTKVIYLFRSMLI